MKKGLTELVFIMDRSGSMRGLEKDTIGGYNAMIARQKEEPGEVYVSIILFDDQREVIHDRTLIEKVPPLTAKEYYVRGCTALLDAVGSTIYHIDNAHKCAKEEERPEKTIFIITTDGMENSSCLYSYSKIKEMVEKQQNQYGWEFIFLGANIDAIGEATRMGIRADRAANYKHDSQGTKLSYDAVSKAVASYRMANCDEEAHMEDFLNEIEADYHKRS